MKQILYILLGILVIILMCTLGPVLIILFLLYSLGFLTFGPKQDYENDYDEI